MVAWMSQWLQNIILIVLLATFADLLLPSSAMQKYSKMVLGLLIIVVILSPILELFTKEYSFNELIQKIEGEWYNNQAVSAMNRDYTPAQMSENEQQLIQKVEESMAEHLNMIIEKESEYSLTKVTLDANIQDQAWIIHSAAIFLKAKERVEPVKEQIDEMDTVVTVEIEVDDIETKIQEEVNANTHVNEELSELTKLIEKELGLKKGQVIIYLN